MGLSEPGERCSQGREARGAVVTEGLSHSQNHSAELGSRKGDGRSTPDSLSSLPSLSRCLPLAKLTEQLEGRGPMDALHTRQPPRQRAVHRMAESASGWGSVTSPLPHAASRSPSWAPRLLVKGGVSSSLEPFSESTVSLRSALLGTRALTERADTEGKGKF